MTLGFT